MPSPYPTHERETVTIKRAQEIVGVSRRTIYNWIQAGKIGYARTAGGSVRIFVDTLWQEKIVEPSAPSERHVESR
jgi:excisionase family DNA binding protein